MKTATKWVIGVLGVTGTLGGLWYLSKKSVAFGEYRPGRMPMPKAVSKTSAGGMTLTRYSSPKLSLNQRIGVIQDAVFKGVQDPRMRQIALAVTRECPERDGSCEAKAIFNAVKDRIRYTGDVAPIKLGKDGPVEGIDFFQTPYRTWEFGGEDCDGHATLLATLLALNGITPRLRVTAQKDEDWSHIYVIAGLPKESPSKWVALDTTLPGRRYNVEAPYAKLVDYDA